MQRLNLLGQRFGRLTVLEDLGKDNRGKPLWLCRCDCGAEVQRNTMVLRTGKTRSCGCLRKETAAEHCREMTKHGHYIGNRPSPEWAAWNAMKQRCTNAKCPEHVYYGARGIAVCARWMAAFENFLADMGPRPGKGYSIDRIDNSKGYEPGNCRWATSVQQNNNTRFNRNITAFGETLTLAEWCRKLGIRRDLFRKQRLAASSDQEAMETIVARLTF